MNMMECEDIVMNHVLIARRSGRSEITSAHHVQIVIEQGCVITRS